MIRSRLGGYLRAPASAEAVANFRLGSRPLPEAARSFYSLSNGFYVPEMDTELMSLSAAGQYGEAIGHLVIPAFFDLLPITDSDDSSPYCIVLATRLNGAVMRLDHEGEVRVTHSSLSSFLGALAQALEDGAEHIGDLLPEEITDPRLVAGADALVHELLQPQNPDFDVLFPVISACSPEVLMSLLEADDIWVREEAATRCGRLELVKAREALMRLAGRGTGQDSAAARASLKRINRKLLAKGQ